MEDTAISLSEEQQQRFIEGHSGADPHKPVHVWDLDALAGAGAIRSTAGDMLTYLEAQLHPEKYPPLSSAIRETHQIRDRAAAGHSIGLAWQWDEKCQAFEHGGATAGYRVMSSSIPKRTTGPWFLSTPARISLLPAELLGNHICASDSRASLPLSLAKLLVPGKSSLQTTLRARLCRTRSPCSRRAIFLFGINGAGNGAIAAPSSVYLRVSSILQMAAASASFCSRTSPATVRWTG